MYRSLSHSPICLALIHSFMLSHVFVFVLFSLFGPDPLLRALRRPFAEASVREC